MLWDQRIPRIFKLCKQLGWPISLSIHKKMIKIYKYQEVLTTYILHHVLVPTRTLHRKLVNTAHLARMCEYSRRFDKTCTVL